MKAIQITMDERLLSALDGDEEVQRLGRSAVLRRITAHYLEQRKRSAVAAQYRQAYGTAPSLEDNLACWEEEGVWPEE